MQTQSDGTPLALRVSQFCNLVGISRTSFYKYVSKGQIRIVKIGGRTLIPVKEMARLLNGGRHDQ